MLDTTHTYGGEIWQNCLAYLRTQISEEEFNTWFRPIEPMFDGTTLSLRVPNRSYASRIDEYYMQILKPVIINMYGSQVRFRYMVDRADSHQQVPATADMTAISRFNTSTDTANIKNPFVIPGVRRMIIDPQLNPNYTFDSFIEGECNRLARSAAMSVAVNPGNTPFNPLYIYGDSGLGKTHVVQAIGHEVRQRHPELQVLYVSMNKFQAQ